MIFLPAVISPALSMRSLRSMRLLFVRRRKAGRMPAMTNDIATEPRIQPLGVEELTDDLWQMILRMSELNAAINSRDKEMLTDVISRQAQETAAPDFSAKLRNLPEIMRTMLKHPQLFARQAEIGIQLLARGALSGRDRELAILRTAGFARPRTSGVSMFTSRRRWALPAKRLNASLRDRQHRGGPSTSKRSCGL